MNRKIIYRAWNKVNKRMLYMFDEFGRTDIEQLSFTQRGITLQSLSLREPFKQELKENDICLTEIIYENGKRYRLVDSLDESEFELMQFTGLRDMNGIMIFEGDFIKNNCFDLLGVVEWEPNILGWVIMDHNTKSYADGSMLWNGGVEVVGNIYNNPELLETDGVRDE
ncbi:hypothetical protein KAU11_07750 [Candidatus Babeliales bacterium]|nr:hypothetical protein [Candidatus Babeliales bacterium]